MNRKETLLTLLRESAALHRALADELGAEAEREGTWERWAFKDHVGHAATWQRTMLDDLAAWQRGEAIEYQEEFEERNAEIFAANRHRPLAALFGEWEQGLAEATALVAELDEVGLGDPEEDPWGRGEPLWRAIVGNGYMHPVIHLIAYLIDEGDLARVWQLHEQMAARLAPLDDGPRWRSSLRYNLACAYALTGQDDAALAALAEVLPQAPNLRKWAPQDPDLRSLHGTPAFQALLAGEEG